ncbi:MAG: diaminopimelate epimerase [Deltaproteobacteria bacterium]
MPFVKMHGLGNDFMVIDCRRRFIHGLSRLIKRLSDRRFGVGFDQALILKASEIADFRLDIYNHDGSRVEMCGNGIRCLANYIWSHGLSKKSPLAIETLAGVIRPEKDGSLVRVDMGEPILEGRRVPVGRDGIIKDLPLKIDDRTFNITCVSMGNPHCVIFVEDVGSFPVERYGPLLENNRFFPKRTNVEFIEVINSKRIKMRVWERGSGETLACGTGASAAAVASHLKGFTSRSVSVYLRGGVLSIDWGKDNHVYMTGPAEEVFEGYIRI